MKQGTTITEIWEKSKKNFVYGKDYIETETDEYLVICPFNYSLLSLMYDTFRFFQCDFHFTHCVCESLGAFLYWYRGLYRDGRVKTFFIKKDINLEESAWNQDDELAEFTGWVDFSDRNFLHFAHDIRNRLLTGEYHNYEYDYAYNRTVTKGCKKLANKVNLITSQVYDEIFRQYDKYIDDLEETLHNLFDDYQEYK